MEPLPAEPWTEWLRTCRRNLGSRTGDFWKENRRRLEISPLLRPGRKDPLDRLWKDQERLFTRGEVQLALLVCPDEDVTPPAWAGRPTLILHSPDPRFAASPHEFEALAIDLPRANPAIPRIEELLAEQHSHNERASWIPIPDSVTRGRECYLSTVYLHRDAMPDRWLAGEVFPVLCLRDETPAITMVPWEFWPAELVRSWRENEAPQPYIERESVVVHGYGWPVPAFLLGSWIVMEHVERLATGNADPFDEHSAGPAIALTIGSVLLLLFDRRERKRAAQPRYFSPEHGHPITVTLSRGFIFLGPRIWAGIALTYSAWTMIRLLVHR